MREAENNQYCRVDVPDAAAVTVILRCSVAEAAAFDCSRGVGMGMRRHMRREEKYIAGSLFSYKRANKLRSWLHLKCKGSNAA